MDGEVLRAGGLLLLDPCSGSVCSHEKPLLVLMEIVLAI